MPLCQRARPFRITSYPAQTYPLGELLVLPRVDLTNLTTTATIRENAVKGEAMQINEIGYTDEYGVVTIDDVYEGEVYVKTASGDTVIVTPFDLTLSGYIADEPIEEVLPVFCANAVVYDIEQDLFMTLWDDRGYEIGSEGIIPTGYFDDNPGDEEDDADFCALGCDDADDCEYAVMIIAATD